ncbi:MAG: putative CRISPR-associated protein, partial [Candidatus Sericytochromatia bacterium]|nr:putative CRISPR-associated protein [Candidatus Tanganyikabacteria bacterium]
MSRLIVCTVGTSLLSNADRPWAGWNPRRQDPLPDAADVALWLEDADAAAASAETNTLRALDVGEADRLAFLHSDTSEGRFCAERLATLYARAGVPVETKKIGKLGYGADHFSAGLKALVDITISLVRTGRERGQQPIFCATGGFKAEIAFLNLIGALLGVEVVYLHELHRELVRLPQLPLSWDAAIVARHQDFFTWIDGELR